MKNNKTIIALLIIAIVGVVGLTIAYFSNSSSITNTFNTNPYGTTVTEEFISPTNWLPGTTTPKTLVVTNSGSVDEAVRVSYTESWTSANSNTEGDLALSQNNNRAALINWTNPSDWTEVTEGGTTYRYYNYKLAPNEVTTSLLESVTFNPLITNSSNCTTTESNGTKTITCNSTGNGYDGATYKLVFTIETVQYNKYVEAWGTNVAILEEKPQPTPSGTQYLATTATNEVNAEYNASTKGKMFQFTHTVNNQTVNESRYIGNDPNNYVYFNCTDDTDTDTCEVWRIIGTFDVERTDPEDSTKTITETRMKIVRGSDFASTMQWDNRTSEYYPNDNYGKNEWVGSVMNTYLNGTYLESLSATAQSQIEDAIYYLGGGKYDSTTHYGSTEDIYTWERGTETFNYDNYCLNHYWDGKCTTENYCENNPTDEICNATRNTSWVGKVALMYPSDLYMTYAKGVDDTCYNDPYYNICTSEHAVKGWIHNTNKLEGSTSQQRTWLLSPNPDSSSHVFFENNDANLTNNFAYFDGGGRPVVYLKSDIKIDGGTGEEGSPYVLK